MHYEFIHIIEGKLKEEIQEKKTHLLYGIYIYI
jgi:hypothetical protein